MNEMREALIKKNKPSLTTTSEIEQPKQQEVPKSKNLIFKPK